MTQEVGKRGGAVEDALEAVEDVEDIAALKQAKRDAEEVDFADEEVAKDTDEMEHDPTTSTDIACVDGHVEDFMFGRMLDQLNMAQLFPISDFQL